MLALALVSLIVQQLFLTGFAFSLKLIIDQVMTGTNTPPVEVILGGLLLLFGVMAGASFLGEYTNAQAAALILNNIRRQLHTQLQRLAVDFFVRTQMGDILARFSGDLKALEVGYTQAFLNFILTVIGILINVPILFYLEWRLALITVTALPILLFLTSRLVRRSVAAGGELREREAEVLNMAQETVRAQQIIKTFVLESVISAGFEARLTRLAKAFSRSRFLTAVISKSSSLGVLLIQLLVTVVGAVLALRGQISVGVLVSFITLLNTMTKDVYEFAKKVIPILIEAASGVERIEALLREPMEVQDLATPLPSARFDRQINFENVVFSYTGGQANLRGVNLSIAAGQSVVFVGASGSGKSTVLSLVMRFYDPQHGAVTFDGVDIRKLSLKSLRKQMGAVFQENYLFNASIAENIRVGKPDATAAEVEHAARAAEIHDLIVSLPEGYHTLVGEAGGRLSGGQRQRIAIARAILCNPAILLLDEATSALDPGTEEAVNQTLTRLAVGRTVITITHRLKSAQTADHIFVLHNGELVEQGTHHSLLSHHGVYFDLWHKQTGFEVRRDGRYAQVKAERLRHIALFAKLTDAILLELAGKFYSEYYEAGQVVIRQGQTGDKFYLVARGQVAVRFTDAEGVDHFIERLDDGDHFGEMALISNESRNATVVTLEPCLFMTMLRDDLLGLIETHPEIAGGLQARMDLSLQNLLNLRNKVAVTK